MARRRNSCSEHRRAFQKQLKALPRPHPEPWLEWHLQLYDQYSRVKRKLLKHTDAPFLDERELEDLNVVRGAELNIDDPQPIDLEPRFFLAGSLDVAEEMAKLFEARGEKWPRLCPEKDRDLLWNGRQSANILYVEHFCNAISRMMEWSQWDESLRTYVDGEVYSNWKISQYTWTRNPTKVVLHDRHWVAHRHEFHEFCIRGLYRSETKVLREADPEISHALATVGDTTMPDDRILRSELLMAVMLLRHNLAERHWSGHHTFPMLVLSFHEGGARMLQIHSANGKLHVRVSRRLNLLSHVNSVPADVRLLAQWYLAKPIGDTCFYDSPGSSMSPKEEPRRYDGLHAATALCQEQQEKVNELRDLGTANI